jgi:hypothetical protein
MNDQETGVNLIAKERQRQIEKEGWSADHDDQHGSDALAMAAALYASPKELYVVEPPREGGFLPTIEDPWPWWNISACQGRGTPSSKHAWDKRKVHSRKRRLEIAGALIAAELDRIIRNEK